MDPVYIQFEAPNGGNGPPKEARIITLFMNLLASVLKKIVPKANPDFDARIDDVKFWLVEFDNETGIPQREIGMNKEGEAIVKMPYKENYGYWTDNNLLLSDFKKQFAVSEIPQENFVKNWERFSL